MKKILALILVLITMLSLVACGGGENKKETSAETNVEEKVENNEDVKEPETEEKEDKTEDKKTEDKKDTQDNKKPQETKPADKTETTKPVEKPVQKPEEKPEEKPAESVSKTAGNTLLADFKAKAGSHSSALSLAEAVSQNSIIPFAAAAMTVEPGYLAGFDAEIGGFKEGAMFGPVIGSIPFVGYVFVLEDGADTASFISTLKSNANLRWNICVEAEEMVAGSSGNKVFFVMSNKSFEE